MSKNNNSSDKEGGREVSEILSSKDPCDDGYLKNSETECFIQKQANKRCSTKVSVLQKPVLKFSFFALMFKNLENYV